MTSLAPDTATTTAADHRLAGSLGPGSIVFMVVAAAAPLTVIAGGAPLGILLGNGAGYPAMFAAVAVVLLIFSAGLSTMSRLVPKPGAFFTYVGYGLNRRWGLGAAYLALLTYTAVQIAVYAYLGFSLNLTVTSLGGPSLPWGVYTLAIVALVGYLGYRHIELSSKVLGVLLVGEILIVLALGAVVIGTGGAEGLSLAPFSPAAMTSGAPGVGLMFAAAGFIGFESTAIYRDEAKDPERTIPRATYAAVILIGVFYTFGAWVLVMAEGPSRVLEVAAQDPGAMVINTTAHYLGPIGGVIVNALLLTSLFACVLSFHNVIARYQHSMAHAGTLPAVIKGVHPVHGSPAPSSLAQTITAAVLIIGLALAGLDPVLAVFTWFSGVSTLGVVVLMAMTSLAVLVFFARHRDIVGSVWQTRVLPVLGLIGLVTMSVLIVAYFPVLVGGGPVLTAALIATVPLALAGGYAQAVHLRRRRPELYADLTEHISA
ncbi:APC family permease [Raineyella fluvialis]|uniref:Amino acid permease n=1 Tax=Raineyella fluvialis TaxID=2662261 RepID=A0A5Q2FD94_9ACTN|nr:APC family permease [Raineyella fluvialis]QGF23053.1 amino acid permease [Raineyella fluvialis]